MMLEDEEEYNPPAATFFSMLILSLIMCCDAVIDTYLLETLTMIAEPQILLILYPIFTAIAALGWGYFIDKYGRK